MNTANLELCRELYEVSGWDKTTFNYNAEGKLHYWIKFPSGGVPAYDLGYLLRKLPKKLEAKEHTELSLVFSDVTLSWRICFFNNTSNRFRHVFHGYKPENAAAKLAIELFKQGVLK